MKLPGILFASIMLSGRMASAVSLSSFDDFQSGNTAWQNGLASGIVSLGGGPAGQNDYFLQVPSYAGGGESSRLIIVNQGEWSGDYLGAGIAQIEMDLANFGPSDLWIRLAFTEVQARVGYVSLAPMLLPAGTGWRHFVFQLDASVFAAIGTTRTFVQALGSVSQFRILSQGGGAPTSTRGDSIDASLGIDNIDAVVPEPSAGFLGLCTAALSVAFGRVRSGSPAGGHLNRHDLLASNARKRWRLFQTQSARFQIPLLPR